MSNIGDTDVYDIKCYNETDELFDPDVVEVSIVGLANAEELVTYNGTEPHDNWLSRVSLGVYRLIVTRSKDGCVSILPRWKHRTTLGDGLLVKSARRALTETGFENRHQFRDRA